MASLVASKEKMFIPQTKQLFEKSAAVHLARHCPSTRAERIFMDWLWWILQGLPFTHLVRVMDCFFNEGIKVLYRVAMAILLLFYKYSAPQNSEWMNEILTNGIDTALNKFCKQIPVSPTKVLRTAFGIRALSSAYISRVFVKTEMLLKSRTVLSGSRQLVRSRSSDNLPTSQSQVNIQMMSHTLTIREVSPTKVLRTAFGIRALSSAYISRVFVKTEMLLKSRTVLSGSRQLVRSRSSDNLPTSQSQVNIQMMSHTLTIREVFGAYCSTRWYERNVKDDHGNRQAYFGTGETFLFSLYPERAKYPWVGMDCAQGESGIQHSAELFMAADSKMITIGQAIWMDENIRFGKTDSCLTFNNPPLCDGGDFEIRVLEVYGFHGA
ncbi:hypothetical protein C0J52_25531 [Blattella germanica]|nr:hypothetical protein C0J52_25531 [Blattella germanica]